MHNKFLPERRCRVSSLCFCRNYLTVCVPIRLYAKAPHGNPQNLLRAFRGTPITRELSAKLTEGERDTIKLAQRKKSRRLLPSRYRVPPSSRRKAFYIKRRHVQSRVSKGGTSIMIKQKESAEWLCQGSPREPPNLDKLGSGNPYYKAPSGRELDRL